MKELEEENMKKQEELLEEKQKMAKACEEKSARMQKKLEELCAMQETQMKINRGWLGKTPKKKTKLCCQASTKWLEKNHQEKDRKNPPGRKAVLRPNADRRKKDEESEYEYVSIDEEEEEESSSSGEEDTLVGPAVGQVDYGDL